MFEVHQSTLKCWRRCKRQYFYKYVQNLQKRRKVGPAIRGTIVHNMLENDANGADAWAPLHEKKEEVAKEKLFPEEKQAYAEIFDEIERLMTAYLKWYRKDPLKPIKNPKTGLLAEHKFEAMLTPSIVLAGKIDRVSKDRNGDTWLQDHKTHKRLPSEGSKYSDIQSALYCWVMPQIGFKKPTGVCWDYIRWKAPAIPQLLKSGEMSRRDADTTWDVYRQTLISNNLNPADYADMEEKLAGKEHDFFQRSYLPVNAVILDTLLDEARTTAREIKRKGGVDTTRTTDRHCDWCDYYNLCQAELRGHDADFIRKHDYEEKKHEEEHQGKEEE